MRIGIVANELSGDLLGAGLMRELRMRLPDVIFEGVGGPNMTREGCHSLYPMERLSVMGLVEVLRHLPGLLLIRRGLASHFLKTPPDLFIGIDAPDFNLGLERRLKRGGITTVHYVSPAVWAWREKRALKIASAVDLLLSILPFEKPLLERYQIPVVYVGHPLADEIPLQVDRESAQKRLGLEGDAPLLALLPGSRMSEVEALTDDFLGAARLCRDRYPDLRCVVPLVHRRARELFDERWRRIAPDLPLTLVEGASHDVMAASDLVLTASGTATLEAMLLKRPMVIAYRLHPITHWILKTFHLVKIPFYSLVNLLAGEEIAKEFIQQAITPEALAGELLALLDSPRRVEAFQERALRIHQGMRQDASRQVAKAVLQLIESKRGKDLEP